MRSESVIVGWLLDYMPGVEPVAHTLLADLPELGALTCKEIASLVGVAPFGCESGIQKGRRHIGRTGVRATRPVPGRHERVQHNPILAAFHQRLKAAGKAPKVALVAALRKLVTILNAMLKTGQPWT